MKGDDPNAVRIVLSTHPDRQKALDLARRLVDERLAACVNVVDGATSIYRWEGKVCEEPEFLLIIKTAERCIGKLKHR
ncbi:MAG: divalent-cation tolerance protein CutA, partial [Leptospirillia bacterium]